MNDPQTGDIAMWDCGVAKTVMVIRVEPSEFPDKLPDDEKILYKDLLTGEISYTRRWAVNSRDYKWTRLA